jgi:hypothetical protein
VPLLLLLVLAAVILDAVPALSGRTKARLRRPSCLPGCAVDARFLLLLLLQVF